MPVVDEYGNYMTPTYNREQALIGGGMTPAQVSQQYAGAQQQSGSTTPWSSFSGYTGSGSTTWSPTSGFTPTDDQFREWIIGSPEYKTRLEQLQQDYDAQKGYADRTKALQNDQYGAQVADADRARTLREKQIKETLAGRGMLSSGQTAFELNDANYSYQTFLRDLDFQRKMRLAGEDLQESQRDTSLARNRYQAFIEVSRHYRDLWWDPTTGRYRGQGGG